MYSNYGGSDSGMVAGLMIVYVVVILIALALGIAIQWKLFTKAGEAGWKAIVPILNSYTLVKIVDGEGIKFLLLCIPVVNFIYAIILCFRMAAAYGKDTGFGVGLLLLPVIFQMILAFGSAQYVGPKGIPQQPQYMGQPYPQQPYGGQPQGPQQPMM